MPRLGIASSLIDLEIAADGTLEVPVDYDQAGWWSQGPMPGSSGHSIIVGHVDSKAGPAIFYRLRELVAGDTVEVDRADGSMVVFTVREQETVDKDAFPTDKVYRSTDGKPTLRLITCGGTFDESEGSYRSNVVVYLDRTL